MSTKIIFGVFAAFVAVWASASLFFTVAGRDAPCDVVYDMPAPVRLTAEENAYTAITNFASLRHAATNAPHLLTDYKLRQAYLDGTTNRMDLVDEARALLAAESNTVAMVGRLLAARGIDVPTNEAAVATSHFCTLLRVANICKVKATYEASIMGIDAGRDTLLSLYRAGRFLMASDSLASSIADIIGSTFCFIALDTAATPLFAPDDDEAWRRELRTLNLQLLDGDAARTKTAAMRSLSCFALTSLSEPPAMPRLRAVASMMSTGKLERNFLAALLTACPGYMDYAFQPNRRLARCREYVERLCRTIDAGTYDVAYATERKFPSKNLFSRNWLGETTLPPTGWHGDYRRLFLNRFHRRAQIAVLACRSYRAKYGRDPETLSALVPEFLDEVPRDPYDGEELRYDRTNRYIWTRGEDQSFDGKVMFDRLGRPRWSRSGDSRSVRFLLPKPAGGM